MTIRLSIKGREISLTPYYRCQHCGLGDALIQVHREAHDPVLAGLLMPEGVISRARPADVIVGKDFKCTYQEFTIDDGYYLGGDVVLTHIVGKTYCRTTLGGPWYHVFYDWKWDEPLTSNLTSHKVRSEAT